MPTYCYSCNCGHTAARVLPVKKAHFKPKCRCGKLMSRDFLSEQLGVAHHPGNWPMKSQAAGVHPDQVPEAIAQAVAAGVPTQFTRDGDAVFTSASHRKRFCENVSHQFDRNGGYGDPQRRH